MRVFFQTFGCRLNRAEALDEEARYIAAGHQVVDTRHAADLIIVRCCAVTGRAQHECEKYIDRIHADYPNKTVHICGCSPKAETDIQIPGDKGGDPIPARTARAYLKVQDGCSGKCTFCTVPKYRGSSRSEDFSGLIDRAKRFVDAGYHEIVVTGCNLALYASQGKRLADLTAALAEIDKDCRIRIGSVEPGKAAEELVVAMSEHKNICRFLHLPIQSGSNRILAEMGRPYTLDDIHRISSLAVRTLDPIALGADIITGFPGETDNDYRMTKRLLASGRYVNTHVFTYSERPGTPAATARGQVPREVRSIRARELAAIGDGALDRFTKRFIGNTVEVVIESDTDLCGWTEQYLWLQSDDKFPVKYHRRRKSIMKFRVRKALQGKLIGSPIWN